MAPCRLSPPSLSLSLFFSSTLGHVSWPDSFFFLSGMNRIFRKKTNSTFVSTGCLPLLDHSPPWARACPTGKRRKRKKKVSAQPRKHRAIMATAPKGDKTKSKGRRHYYAVRVGRCPGVLGSWEEARASVAGHKGAVFRRFDDAECAHAYAFGGHDGSGRQTPLRVCIAVAPPPPFDRDRVFRYGICWGPGDPRNESGRLPGDAQSERRAGLYAMARAARSLAADRWMGPVEICSDCSHAIMWARDYMPTWKRDGWTTSRDAEPLDVDILKSLSEAIERMGGGVRFVHRLRLDRSPLIEAARRLAGGSHVGSLLSSSSSLSLSSPPSSSLSATTPGRA